jgi:hypothetical protein
VGYQTEHSSNPYGHQRTQANNPLSFPPPALRPLATHPASPSLTLSFFSTSIPHLLTLLHTFIAILSFPPSAIPYTLTTTSVRVTDKIMPSSLSSRPFPSRKTTWSCVTSNSCTTERVEGGVTSVGFGICCWRDDEGEQVREASRVCRFGPPRERQTTGCRFCDK